MRLSGHLFEALSSQSKEGEIELFNGKANVFIGQELIFSDVEIESIQQKKDIYLKNGNLFALKTALDSAQVSGHESKLKKTITWLEDFSIKKALVLSTILISALIVFRLTLTLITPFAVSVFPSEWEEVIGRNSYESLKSTIFEPSDLSPKRIAYLNKETKKIAAANNIKASEVLFHKSDIIRVNALAFPGGPIVVTDGLVSLLQRDDLILSVIAHEMAHVNERHSLHQIIEIIGVTAIVSVLLGADQSFIEEASVIGINIWANKKSRDFEKDADLKALNYLNKAGLDKALFAEAIKILTTHFCSFSAEHTAIHDCVNDKDNNWLSTHPSGGERLEYLHSH